MGLPRVVGVTPGGEWMRVDLLSPRRPGDGLANPGVVVFCLWSAVHLRSPSSADRINGVRIVSRFGFVDGSRVLHDFKARKQLHIAGRAAFGYHADAKGLVGREIL